MYNISRNKVLRKTMGFLEKRRDKGSVYIFLIAIESILIKILQRIRREYKAIIISKNKAIYFPIEKVATRTLYDTFNRERPIKFARKKNFYKKYKNYFKFAFVRNPYSRLVSCYRDKILSKEDQEMVIKNGFYRNMPFDDFVREVSLTPDIRADQHIKSQSFSLLDRNNNLLVDEVFKFEDLEKDIGKVCKKINMPIPEKIGHKNRSHDKKNPNKNYMDYYTLETKKLVQKRYRKDFELFGYDF